MDRPEKLIAVILCGGAGSRLWPLSRLEHPKPFIKMPDQQSLIQKAASRAVGLPNVIELFVVSNEFLLFNLHEQIRPVLKSNQHLTYILEPCSRNTAAAISVAVQRGMAVHGDEVNIIVLSADHLIENETAFNTAVTEAITLSAQDLLVTFGIHPDRPETGYGYMQVKDAQVLRFTEKPSQDLATEFLKAGDYFWNAGMFCFKAGVMNAELEQHCPALLETTRKSLTLAGQSKLDDAQVLRLSSEHFAQAEDISVDYAVMEKTHRAAAITCDIGWHDVGSWSALSDIYPKDPQGNAIQAEVCLHQVEGSFFHSRHRLIAATGVKDLVVVDTPDAILVANKNASQDVKVLYQALQNQNHKAHRSHNKVYRPWGSYTVLEVADHYKIKRIEVKPGGCLSLQSHQFRSEHWVVIEGQALVINDDQQLVIHQNESTFIHAGHKHRLSNPYDEKLVIIEVQTGSYVGEDDIVRFEDIYGRC